ncbi:transmembrane and immunoglobulin domain-containing protein 1 [Centropristis striata]|uniref:transmembrane and immunoglobulin domain-containing protein 1 n=1 Tax=Centropristis striata TaxID=184440 RepID=UPI0027DEEF75|nr:transmembrane and immunoglobulin domain-containing protein 1 [Centropristis striata]
MKFVFNALIFHFLLYCATHTLGVEIQSDPEINGDRVIHTELEETVSLVCQLGGSHETPADEELVWRRNGNAIRLAEGNRKGRSSVCVSPVIYEDNGATFSCHLSKNNTATASVTLNVTYRPQLSGSEDVAVEAESVLVLQCDIWANPPVSSVTWTLNGSLVDLLAGGFSVISDGFTSRLTAESADKSLHEGAYQCTAESPKYGVSSKQFNVAVTEKIFKFPLMPAIAGIVVLVLTSLLAVASRWKKIRKCCK